MAVAALTLTQKKRRDILAACIDEFRDHGFAGARIDRIAERAQVSKRTLYKHFASKEAMFDAIMAIALAPLPHDRITALEPEQPLKPQLRDLLLAYVRTISDDHHIALSRVIVSEFIHDPASSRGAYARAEVAAGPVESLIDQAMDAGLLRRADPGFAATQLSAMLKAFLYWPKFMNEIEMIEEDRIIAIIDDCLDMFLKHYAVA